MYQLVLACILASGLYVNAARIAIVSLYDENFTAVGSFSDLNKQAYASKHGYDIYLYHHLLDTTRPPAWSKIKAVQNHLKDYDWIFWTDADCLIMNDTISLEQLIDNRYDFIITQESALKNLNTGNFLIKNTPWSHALLDLIYKQEDCIHASTWEQYALAQILYRYQNLTRRIKVLHQRAMNSHPTKDYGRQYRLTYPEIYEHDGGEYMPGDFIIHFYGPCAKDLLMKEWYRKTQKN